jgi:predicted AAA+ superfamily ATPase
MLIPRNIATSLHKTLKTGKSILVLGPRQTGKTTFLSTIKNDLALNLALPRIRQSLEKDPEQLIQIIDAIPHQKAQKRPLVFIDEIQKVPSLTDVIQVLIDEKKAQFIITGSSARKLKKQTQINLLPGRVIQFKMDPLNFEELNNLTLNDYLLNGSLPGIALIKDRELQEQELESYVEIYLEEEIRAEALVRNLPGFYRFLEIAALESGKIISANAMSQDIGVAQTTIQAYYEILEDCLIIERIAPITKNATRKKLTKSPKYLFYDMGVRRIAAHEGTRLNPERMGELFEHWIGLELLRLLRNQQRQIRLHFWRDPDGPEVDWVIEKDGCFLPIEVKYKDKPSQKDARHLHQFLQEYNCPWGGIIVCQTPHALKLTDQITAYPWKQFLQTILKKHVLDKT